MKKTKILLSLVAWSASAGMLMTSLAACGVSPIITMLSFIVVTALLAFSKTEAANLITRNDVVTIDQVFWAKEIVTHLYKNNGFLKQVRNDSQYVVGGIAVVIPQSGSKPAVIKDNASWPMVAVQRADTMIMYGLHTYITQPTFITISDLLAISYDKTQDVLKDHFSTITEQCADDQLINWANGLPGATNVVYTTGPATASLEIGQGGSRLTCTWQDVKKLQRLMNKDNIAGEGRNLLMEANMFDQFTDSLSETQSRDFSRYFDATSGVLGRMFGFNIMTRSSVLAASAGYDGNGNLVVNPLNAALSNSDNIGCLAWQMDSLALAMGEIKLFTRIDDPLYAGSVNNCFIKAGGRVRRSDNKGVYTLMQGTPAG